MMSLFTTARAFSESRESARRKSRGPPHVHPGAGGAAGVEATGVRGAEGGGAEARGGAREEQRRKLDALGYFD